MKKSLILMTIGFLLSPSLMGLEIPLSGTGDGTAKKIAYVDMERIFQVYPQTKAAKEDYLKKREKMREDLSGKEAKLEEIRQKLAVLESTLISADVPEPEAPPVPDDATPPPPAENSPESITKLKIELEELEIEYKEARDRADQDLTAFETKQTQIILGKIYDALRDLAAEEQVDLIVDKSSILFGSAEIDLTEKLQKRVRGF